MSYHCIEIFWPIRVERSFYIILYLTCMNRIVFTYREKNKRKIGRNSSNDSDNISLDSGKRNRGGDLGPSLTK